MNVMFIVFNMQDMFRVAAFGSFDDAETYRRGLDGAEHHLIETVEEDEDLFHVINR